ncbi:alpha/beta-hydrolase [Mycena olivaceomarginata]|nr:alpha/beta-hydrolase [Mycena olivaceomarginata]
MDESNYKQTKTKRGFNYTYYYSPPAAGKPVAFFQPLGYDIIVPDHLGYRGTDKPTDPKLYIGHGLAADMADILDAEDVSQHDWYIRVLHPFHRLAYSDLLYFRISACAFFVLGYLAAEGVNTLPLHGQIAQMVGYDVLAYQRFFLAPDAAALIEKNIDSFISLLYAEKPESWKDTLCVGGGARAWDKENLRSVLLSGGLAAPLCWYKANVDEANLAEDASACRVLPCLSSPPAARDVTQPFLYVAFTKDIVALLAFSDSNTGKYVMGPVTRKEVAADHWGVSSHAAELNEILVNWIGGLALKL